MTVTDSFFDVINLKLIYIKGSKILPFQNISVIKSWFQGIDVAFDKYIYMYKERTLSQRMSSQQEDLIPWYLAGQEEGLA